MADEPITREEQFLSAAAGNEINLPTPITREEMYLAKAAGVNINITMLDPITRKERYLHAIAEGGGSGGGGGSSVEVEALNVTQNGEYSEEGKAYSPVTVNVPNTYTVGDEGKVVSNGALVAQSSDTVTANDTYDTTLINSLTVNVQASGVSNIVTGTFIASEGINALDVGYTGNGYPIAAIFAVDGGLSNPDYTDWYNAVANGAVGMWSMTKSNMTSTPTYNGSYITTDGCSVSTLRKTSDAQTYQTTGGALVATFAANANPNSSPNTCIKIADKKTFNYYASTAGGLKTGIKYRYWIVYSE